MTLIPITVTGTDSTGQLFQERTSVLGLKGRDCEYQSKHEVQTDGCVVLDFAPTATGQQTHCVKGRVKWLRTLRADRKLFQIGVELDTSQNIVVVPEQRPEQRENSSRNHQAPAMRPASLPTEPNAEAISIRQTTQPVPQLSVSLEATTMATNRDTAPGFGANILAMRKAAQPAVAAESSPEPGTIKNSTSKELEESIQGTVASVVERMVRGVVEKELAQQSQAAMEGMAQHVARQLAQSDPLRGYLESVATRMTEQLSEVSRAAVSKAETDLRTRVSAMQQATEGAIGEMQNRIDEARVRLGDASAKAQEAERKLSDTTARVQEALQQMKEADGMAEGFDERLRSRLDAWTLEMKKRLDQVIVDSTTRWVRDLEQQAGPCIAKADEKLQTLAAGMALAQIQQDRVAELSRTAAANFEKEMRAVFLRWSANG